MPQETENIIKQREEGYYWVRMRPFGKWRIAEWYNGYWTLHGFPVFTGNFEARGLGIIEGVTYWKHIIIKAL